MIDRRNPDMPAEAADLLRNLTIADVRNQCGKNCADHDRAARRNLMMLAIMMGYRLEPKGVPMDPGVILAAPNPRPSTRQDSGRAAE